MEVSELGCCPWQWFIDIRSRRQSLIPAPAVRLLPSPGMVNYGNICSTRGAVPFSLATECRAWQAAAIGVAISITKCPINKCQANNKKKIDGNGFLAIDAIMRTRFLGDSPNFNLFHVISRVVDRRFVLHEDEKEFFRKLLFRQAAFAGVRVVAWCFMSNHFHLLVEVPNKDKALEGWTDEDFLERLEMLRSEKHTRLLLSQLKMWQRNGNTDGVTKVAQGVRDRLFDLSAFVKELKNKFSFWFNKRHGRKGTLCGGALQECAA